MAEVRSTVINEISGKLGNLVFYKRGDKIFVRKWVRPSDPCTDLQIKQRQNFSQLIKIWQNMNPSMKKSWAAHPLRKGSPYNTFMSENLKRMNSGDYVLLIYQPLKKYYRNTAVSNNSVSKDPAWIQSQFSLVITSVIHESPLNNILNYSYTYRDGPGNHTE